MLVVDLLAWANANSYKITFGEAYRTEEQQALYVQQGKSKTMNSRHRDRLAIDLNLFVNGEYKTDKESYKPLGEKWKSYDPECVWGGDWGWDANHFQYTK